MHGERYIFCCCFCCIFFVDSRESMCIFFGLAVAFVAMFAIVFVNSRIPCAVRKHSHQLGSPFHENKKTQANTIRSVDRPECADKCRKWFDAFYALWPQSQAKNHSFLLFHICSVSRARAQTHTHTLPWSNSTTSNCDTMT